MEEIELREYFFILWKRAWLIALITILSVVTSGIISYFVLEPEYQTFATLMVGKPKNSEDTIQYSDVLLNQKLVTTYGEIAKSRVVSKEVIKNLKLNLAPEELRKKINVTLVRDTEIIKIEVTDKDPELAAKIANELSNVFMKHVVKIMKIENVQVIDRAEVPINPVKPKPKLNMAIAGVLGIMISIFIIFFIEYLDNTIKTPEDVERYLDLPVIGIIPDISK
ncbi:hypothetical protein TR13x_04560 [Caloranaerobacter sp. TR13]|uniref:YveK family protein n=1 Tax=Caloranaerobacter sp. TR13 TaxID=1302151 RepID=UPI0006D45C17|nr:Wzz/FepE/Etk N-terminal domain-containing protein [Caloranaerobacter sp. TR13]KPU27359.1 hypothetical protein TR13x_04560 [Caloranaerobacter sp. TR13]